MRKFRAAGRGPLEDERLSERRINLESEKGRIVA